MSHDSTPTIQEVRVRAVRVPMAEPHQTASGVVAECPLVLTDVMIDGGAVGHSIVFTYTPAALSPTADMVRNLEPMVKGEPVAPIEIEQKLARRFRLLGTQGIVGMALAAIDMALWDALARVHGLPLVRLLGGVEKPVRCYGSVGYDGVEGSAKAAERLASKGFMGVKAKIGYPTVKEDVAVIRAVRKAVGPDAAIMVDYNQCLTPTEAVVRLRVLACVGGGADPRPRLRRARAGGTGGAYPHPVRRELVGDARPAPCDRGRGVGLGHAGCDEDRWRHRMAPGRGPRTRERPPGFQPPVAGGQRTAVVLHSDCALAGVRGLVEPRARRTPPSREGHGDHWECPWFRDRVGRRGRASVWRLSADALARSQAAGGLH
jgi:hypothetical protein